MEKMGEILGAKRPQKPEQIEFGFIKKFEKQQGRKRRSEPKSLEGSKFSKGENKKAKKQLEEKKAEKYEKLMTIDIPTSGVRDRYGDTIDEELAFCSDGFWRLEKDKITEEQALEYIKRYFTKEMVQEHLDKIEAVKRKYNLILK